MEKKCIEYFTGLINREYECIKAFDGCNSDILIKHKNNNLDEWIGIQVKTTEFVKKDYGFHLDKKKYNDLLILCMCFENKKMWLIPFDNICEKIKISIGINKSKYNIFEITPENINKKINEYYLNNKRFNFNYLNKPNNIYQHREQLYRSFRENKIDFLNFFNEDTEGLIYDFKINNYKIQEKVGGIHRNGYMFHLVKNNGRKNNGRKNKSNLINYEKGDNNFYWLNCNNMKTFYIFPENVLIEKKIININKVKQFYISSKGNNWYSEYKFEYDCLDKERLLNIFSIKDD